MTISKQKIAPFVWVAHDNSVSVIMNNVGDYRQFIFESRADEGFKGNGYDWQSLAKVYLQEKLPELSCVVNFDSKSGMFCAHSKDTEALKTFVMAFKEACENDELILDIFSRAKLD